MRAWTAREVEVGSRFAMWGLGLMLVLGAGTARATLISYQLSGATVLASAMPDGPLRNEVERRRSLDRNLSRS